MEKSHNMPIARLPGFPRQGPLTAAMVGGPMSAPYLGGAADRGGSSRRDCTGVQSALRALRACYSSRKEAVRDRHLRAASLLCEQAKSLSEPDFGSVLRGSDHPLADMVLSYAERGVWSSSVRKTWLQLWRDPNQWLKEEPRPFQLGAAACGLLASCRNLDPHILAHRWASFVTLQDSIDREARIPTVAMTMVLATQNLDAVRTFFSAFQKAIPHVSTTRARLVRSFLRLMGLQRDETVTKILVDAFGHSDGLDPQRFGGPQYRELLHRVQRLRSPSKLWLAAHVDWPSTGTLIMEACADDLPALRLVCWLFFSTTDEASPDCDVIDGVAFGRTLATLVSEMGPGTENKAAHRVKSWFSRLAPSLQKHVLAGFLEVSTENGPIAELLETTFRGVLGRSDRRSTPSPK